MKRKLKKFIEIITTNEMRILPGNLAYSFFLALIPIISLIFYFVTTFNLPDNVLNDFLIKTFPQSIVDLLSPVFDNKMTLSSLIPICIGIVVSANGCNAIIIASNTIYEFENASFFKRLIKSITLVILLIVLFMFILIVPLLGKTILNIIGLLTSFIGDNKSIIDALYFILQVPVSLIIMFFIIKLVYIIAPDDKVSGKYVNKGATFTTISWLIITLGFSYYINHIAQYNIVYGNLANIVMLLVWFYLLAYVFVIGLFMNKKISDKGIEKTNAIRLDEIRKKVKEEIMS